MVCAITFSKNVNMLSLFIERLILSRCQENNIVILIGSLENVTVNLIILMEFVDKTGFLFLTAF